MDHETTQSKEKLSLPLSIISPVDVARVLRELDAYIEYYHQKEIKKDPKTDVKLPKTSQLLDNILELNTIELTNPTDRLHLKNFLEEVKTKSPVIHASFSVDPSVRFLEKLIAYLRKQINRNLLLTIGLQPNIGAGLTITTDNKYFDFSLRKTLDASGDKLLQLIKEMK